MCELTGRTKKDFSSVPELDISKVCLGHIPYDSKWVELIHKNGWRPLFIYRDPRDQTVSKAHWIRKAERRFYPKAIIECSLEKTIEYLIRNDLGVLTTQGFYEKYMGWKDCPAVYTTTFEKLIGSKGGGSDEIQMQEIYNIIEHIGLSCSPEQVRSVIENAFGGTFTFRKGMVGAWKTELTADHKRLFKQVSGQLLIDLGYEDDLDW